jgi:hypothetical protein
LDPISLAERPVGKRICVDAPKSGQDVNPIPSGIVTVIEIVRLTPGARRRNGQQNASAGGDQTVKKPGTKRMHGDVHRGGSGLEFIHLDLFVFVGNFLSP